MTIVKRAAVLAFASTVMAAPAQAVNRWRVVKPYNNKLEAIAKCESTGRWGINTGNGFAGGSVHPIRLGVWWAVGDYPTAPPTRTEVPCGPDTAGGLHALAGSVGAACNARAGKSGEGRVPLSCPAARLRSVGCLRGRPGAP